MGRLREFFKRQVMLGEESVLFILVNALDLFVTYLVLALGERAAYEANPIAAYILRQGFVYFVVFKFAMVTIGIVCCDWIARRRPRVGRAVLIVLTALVSGVVVYGLYLLLSRLS